MITNVKEIGMKILLAVAAFCLSLASYSATVRTEQAVRALPPPSLGTYLTPTEREVVSSMADRVDAERKSERVMDETFRQPPSGGGITSGHYDHSPFR
jgi:hypothetical protein